MKNTILILMLLASINSVLAQDYTKKTKYLIGTFYTQNTTINGISLGAFPQFNSKNRFVKTNGIRLEIPGMGFLGFIGIGLRGSEVKDEIINGLNISTGTLGNVQYNGLTIVGVSQNGVGIDGVAIAGLSSALNNMSGVQIAGLYNLAKTSKGVQVSFSNTSEFMKGLQIGGLNNANNEMVGVQIGIFNKSKKIKGIQIGLWNVNEKRQLPIVNWNFKNK